MHKNAYPLSCLGIYVLVFVWAAIRPLFLKDWALENILSVLLVLLLVFTYRQFRFSNTAYTLMTVFLILHTIGSHYTYAEVPFGYYLKTLFTLTRNHYDRIVHLSFGLLMTYPIRELLQRKTRLQPSWLLLFSFTTIATFSLLYELIELATAAIVAPDLGIAYLGIQGDLLDGQKDSFLALSGAAFTLLLLHIKR